MTIELCVLAVFVLLAVAVGLETPKPKLWGIGNEPATWLYHSAISVVLGTPRFGKRHFADTSSPLYEHVQ